MKFLNLWGSILKLGTHVNQVRYLDMH